MRDNSKGGALTEVTFFILLSLYTPKHGSPIFSMRALIQRQYNTLPDMKTAKQLWTSTQR